MTNHRASSCLMLILRVTFIVITLAAISQTVSAQDAGEIELTSHNALAPVATENFHSGYTGELVWGNNRHYSELINALLELESHGLNPTQYHLDALRAFSGDLANRDQLATDAWFSAAAHMLYGKLDPLTIEPDWTAAKRQADLPARLRDALANNTVATSLSQFTPIQPGYQVLLTEYAALREQALQPVTSVPLGTNLRRGMRDTRVGALQARLVELEILTSAQLTGILDSDTFEAVKLFQMMLDLDDDGIVGPATITALNRGQSDKIDQVRVNLERWRWLPDDLGAKHLRVNIAAFNIGAWKEGVLETTHLAIVGKTYRKTPVFSDEIEYIIFNPWWEVPPSIAAIDKLPLFRENPELVKELGFEMIDRSAARVDPDSVNWNAIRPGSFPYRLRQSPGPVNALGQVKIMFPNAHNVYIHDTPTRGLFAQRQRAFSSGCLRTQDPLALAAWLLTDTPGWGREHIDSAVASTQETRVNLNSKIPVHVLYFTVVHDTGGVRYLDDIYQRDAAVLTGLQKALH